MASKTGGILHDQNLNIRFNEASALWKTNVSKAPSKRGAALAGRTPLGDLSNSLKPSMNRATRKQSSTLFSPLIEKEAVTFGIALDATKKKNTSKASLKQQPARRKALSDISNSGKPRVNVASKRNDNTKLGVVAEVADEGFLHNHQELTLQSPSASFSEEIDLDDEFPTPELHNHQECINARLRVMDMDRNLWQTILGPDHSNQKLTLQSPSASFRKEIDLDDEFPTPELLPECSDWFKSPPDSPLDSLEPEPEPDSPLPWRWQFEENLTLC